MASIVKKDGRSNCIIEAKYEEKKRSAALFYVRAKDINTYIRIFIPNSGSVSLLTPQLIRNAKYTRLGIF